MGLSNKVFINCPFDDAYLPLLRPLLFTVIYLGFEPRISLERLDSGEARIDKIIKLIEESRFGIHDLSRIRATKKGEYYRLNMPFELGLDVGCRFRGGKWAKKTCLILEVEKHRYQIALSDLSNSDIEAHKDEPEDISRVVRNWLSAEAAVDAPGPTKVWAAFNEFMGENYIELAAKGYSKADVDRLDIRELMKYMKKWVEKNPPFTP